MQQNFPYYERCETSHTIGDVTCTVNVDLSKGAKFFRFVSLKTYILCFISVKLRCRNVSVTFNLERKRHYSIHFINLIQGHEVISFCSIKTYILCFFGVKLRCRKVSVMFNLERKRHCNFNFINLIQILKNAPGYWRKPYILY